MSFQLKSVGVREAQHLWKSSHLASVKGGENKWENIFSSKQHHKCCSAGVRDLLPVAPVPPASVLWLCETPISHHLKKSAYFLCIQCLCWVKQEQCKGLAPYVSHYISPVQLIYQAQEHTQCFSEQEHTAVVISAAGVDTSWLSVLHVQSHVNFFTLEPCSVWLSLGEKIMLWSRLVTGQRYTFAAWILAMLKSPGTLTLNWMNCTQNQKRNHYDHTDPSTAVPSSHPHNTWLNSIYNVIKA